MHIWKRWKQDWPTVDKKTLKADVLAGMTNAAIVLPQGVAFALIAGLPPEYGLYTAMITPVIAALFGSSWHLISGPTTAISLVLFSVLSDHYKIASAEYVHAALAITLMGGLLQLLLGLSGLGKFVPLISHSVMVGFTAGAAILIAGSQFKTALGLSLPRDTSWIELFANLGSVNFYSLLITGVSLVTIVVSSKISKKIPHFLLALFVGTLLSFFLPGPLATVGELPSVFPRVTFPVPNFDFIADFGGPSVTIAILGLIEAVAISRAIAIRSGQKLDSQQEIIGQGLSNVIGSFFSSYMGSGSFTRSGVNYESGARTPLAAVFAAISLLVILIFIAPLLQYLPMPAMAGVIFFVAYRLIDFKEIKHIFYKSRTETWVMGTTFSFCILFDLEMALLSGVLISLGVFLSETAKASVHIRARNTHTPQGKFGSVGIHPVTECPQLRFIRIDGPLYFGVVEELEKEFSRIFQQNPLQKNISINLKGNGYLDFFAAEFLISLIQKVRKKGGNVWMRVSPFLIRNKLEKYGVVQVLGKENLFTSKYEVISMVVPKLDLQICATCPYRVFKECPPPP